MRYERRQAVRRALREYDRWAKGSNRVTFEDDAVLSIAVYDVSTMAADDQALRDCLKEPAVPPDELDVEVESLCRAARACGIGLRSRDFRHLRDRAGNGSAEFSGEELSRRITSIKDEFRVAVRAAATKPRKTKRRLKDEALVTARAGIASLGIIWLAQVDPDHHPVVCFLAPGGLEAERLLHEPVHQRQGLSG